MTDSSNAGQKAGPLKAGEGAAPPDKSDSENGRHAEKEGASRFVPPHPTPVWTVKVTFNTDFAQRVYKRTWDRLKADLYVLTVRTRSNGMDEAAKTIEAVISEAFEHARKDITDDLARSDAIMDDAKLTDLPTYKGAQVVEVEYSTPRAKEFLNLILQMDQLLARYDALWLTGQIETQQRMHRSQNWQRRLIKIANRLRELGNRTRASLAREADKRTEKSEAAGSAIQQPAFADVESEGISVEEISGLADETDTAPALEKANGHFHTSEKADSLLI